MADTVEIKSRFDGRVLFATEIARDAGPRNVRFGLAVMAAFRAGANLRGADLGGADLRGANLRGADLGGADLGGLILVARAARSDGYEYFAWTSILGGCVIRAGCRTWIANTIDFVPALESARTHCRTETEAGYRAEALDIIDYLEKRLAASALIAGAE